MPVFEGIARKIKEIEIGGVPLGGAALGGGSALIISELTDAFVTPKLPTVPVALIKGGEAYAMSRWGHHVIGRDAASLGTLFLGWEAVRAVIPVDDWIKNAIAKVAAAAGGGGGGGTTTTLNPGGNGHHVADSMDVLRTAMLAGGAA